MKHIRIISLLIPFLAFVSCGDWIDVSSRNEHKETDIFKTESGFKSALNGVYVQIGQPAMYGRNTSFYVPELLLGHFEQVESQKRESREYYLLDNDLKKDLVRDLLDEMWSGYFKAVLQINNILENLNSTNAEFSHGNRELIQGEALGLRALLHFDMLRYFGPVPGEASASTPAIPYVDKVTRNPNDLVSIGYGQVLGRIIDDLEASLILLANDPIRNYSRERLNTRSYDNERPEDDWQMYRQRRFNYYAALGIKARVHLWKNEKQEAIACARQILTATDPDGSPKFGFIEEDYFSRNRDLTLEPEHLFGVHNPKLQDEANRYFGTEDQNRPILHQPSATISTLFAGQPNDIRNVSGRYWNEVSVDGFSVNLFYKFTGSSGNKSNNMVPVLKLSEIYLIMMECLPPGEAAEYFEKFRVSRVLQAGTFGNLDTDNQLQYVEKEYLKEFYGEGQMLFFYKRNNYQTIPYPLARPVNKDIYNPEKPESQTMFE